MCPSWGTPLTIGPDLRFCCVRVFGVGADPVQLAARSAHEAPNYGTGFAPCLIPLSLWVGAMVAYTLIQPLNRRALAAGAPAWLIAVAGRLPVVGIGLLHPELGL